MVDLHWVGLSLLPAHESLRHVPMLLLDLGKTGHVGIALGGNGSAINIPVVWPPGEVPNKTSRS